MILFVGLSGPIIQTQSHSHLSYQKERPLDALDISSFGVTSIRVEATSLADSFLSPYSL